MTPRAVQPWEQSVGFLPHKVTVYENAAKGNLLYLRWRHAGNWKKQSLKRGLRTERGKIEPEVQQWALAQATAKFNALVQGLPADTPTATPAAPLTIREGLARAIDARTGKYPTATPHRKEVVREVERAAVVWRNRPWAEIRRADLRALWRHRILELRAEGEVGLRGAEVTAQRVLAVASWLRDEELIPAGACVASSKWKTELKADWLELSGERAVATPKRPRHTLAEMRGIMAKAGEVDPRFELLMALGAEIRLGQVARARRPDLDLEKGLFTVYGRGGKRGVMVELTEGQLAVARRAVTTGYLRELERTAADYPLFPAGQLTGGRKGEDPRAAARHLTAKPVDRKTIGDWFHDAERAAGIEPIPGRAAYGVKRAAVQAAKDAGISREGLKAHGGWTDTQMPDQVYAEQDSEAARHEAATVRARIRGESA